MRILGWDISLSHPTAGAYEPTDMVAPNLVFGTERQDIPYLLRTVLEQEFVFRGADYDYIKAVDDGDDRCEPISMILDRSPFTGAAALEFHLKLTGAEFNQSQRSVKVKVTPNDRYKCVLDNWETEFNILTGTPYSIAPFYGEVVTEDVAFTMQENFAYSISDYINDPESPVTDPTDPAWTVLRVTATRGALAPDGIHYFWDTVTTWGRELYVSSCLSGVPVEPPGNGWGLRIDDCAGSSTSTYTRPIPVLPSNADTISETSMDVSYVYVSRVIDNGRPLAKVIDAYLKDTCGLGFRSDILTWRALVSYSGDVYDTKDIISGLMLFQRSDIKLDDAFQNATIGNTTFKNILDGLYATFGMFWWIDSDGDFRIEHESILDYTTAVDLTEYGKQLNGSDIYTSIEDDFPRRQSYRFDEAYGDERFDSGVLSYPNACAEGSEDYTAPWTTDLGRILRSPEVASNVGFVLVAATAVPAATQYIINSEVIWPTTIYALNGHLSMRNLLVKYHQHRRPFLSGYLDLFAYTFASARRRKVQEVSIVVPPDVYDDIITQAGEADMRMLYTTGLGDGELRSAKYDFRNQTLTLELLQ